MSQSRRILIVEDSRAMRQLMALALQHLPDVIVDEAEDGVAALRALKAARSRPYGLVLLDINMPLLNGMKLLFLMREDPALAGTTVCMVTCDESPESEEQARQLGARYFLRKPVTRKAIEKVVTEVLGAGS